MLMMEVTDASHWFMLSKLNSLNSHCVALYILCSTGRWKIRPFQKPDCCDRCRCHSFHVCVPTKYLHTNIKILTKEEYKIALNCSQLFFSPSSVLNLLSVQNTEGIEIHWDTSQMRYLDKKYK